MSLKNIVANPTIILSSQIYVPAYFIIKNMYVEHKNKVNFNYFFSQRSSERPTRRSLRKTREVLIKEERDQVIMEKFNSPLLLKRLDAATKQIYKNKVNFNDDITVV